MPTVNVSLIITWSMEVFFENCSSPLESMGIISVNAMKVELVRYALNVNQNYIANRDENMVHIKS